MENISEIKAKRGRPRKHGIIYDMCAEGVIGPDIQALTMRSQIDYMLAAGVAASVEHPLIGKYTGVNADGYRVKGKTMVGYQLGRLYDTIERYEGTEAAKAEAIAFIELAEKHGWNNYQCLEFLKDIRAALKVDHNFY